MKIYTKTGDTGKTSLIGGQREMKNHPRLNAYGTVDELNSFLGLLRAKTDEEKINKLIFEIQNTLFSVGANLATDTTTTKLMDFAKINDEKISEIEKTIDKIQEKLPEIKNFIIYGEDELSALCHVCRAIARRAEREIITVNQEFSIDNNLNRGGFFTRNFLPKNIDAIYNNLLKECAIDEVLKHFGLKEEKTNEK